MRLALCLFRYFPFSGLARDMLQIADVARDRGHQVHIFTSAWQGEKSQRHALDILAVDGLTNHSRAAAFHRSLQNRLRSSRFDCVVGFNKIPGLDLYYAADPCYAARVRYTRHPLYRVTPRYHAYRQLEREVFRHGAHTRCLVLSETAKSEYQEFYGTEDRRFTVLPPNLAPQYRQLNRDGSIRQRVRLELNIPAAESVILMVGSGFQTKGVDRSIIALGSLTESLKTKTRLIVVGEGDPAKYIGMARQLGVGDRVVFLGGRTDVPDLLRASDLLVHPAYTENTGSVLLEAMAAGLPVLTTDICGFAHYVRDADAGLVLTTPFNQRSFNQNVAAMLQGDLPGWSRNGVEYVRQPFFYMMSEKAVEAIEGAATGSATTIANPSGFFYLSDKLQLPALKGASLPDVMALSGEVFRQAPGRRTIRLQGVGIRYFVKLHDGVGWREIFKNLMSLRLPVLGAGNEWHALHFLRRKGIRAPVPVGFGSDGQNPARRKSFIITEEIEEVTSLEEFIEQKQGRIDDFRLKRSLIYGLADIARVLHRNGANHRDFYLCHFLVETRYLEAGGGIGPAPISLIDLHRAQLRRKTPSRWVVKDLGGLYYSAMGTNLTRYDLFRFIKGYTGLPLRSALRASPDWARVQRRALSLRRSEPATLN